jgi:adenylate kinase family enzyme
MPPQSRKLLLITGIPGTGKTCYGESFARNYGFVHHNLEQTDLLRRVLSNPAGFVEEILKIGKDTAVTWGFVPNDEQIKVVNLFKEKGFVLVWFDGNRPAALRKFINRKTVSEECFYRQMWAIEESHVVEKIKPIIVNTFDEHGEFKSSEAILEEIAGGADIVL